MSREDTVGPEGGTWKSQWRNSGSWTKAATVDMERTNSVGKMFLNVNIHFFKKSPGRWSKIADFMTQSKIINYPSSGVGPRCGVGLHHQQAPPRGSEAGSVQITPCEIFLGQESLVIDWVWKWRRRRSWVYVPLSWHCPPFLLITAWFSCCCCFFPSFFGSLSAHVVSVDPHVTRPKWIRSSLLTHSGTDRWLSQSQF